MKVYFLISSLTTSAGTERITTLLANELAHLGYDVGVIAIHKGGAPFFSLDTSVKVSYLNQESQTNIYLFYPLNIFKLRRILIRNKADIVIDVCSAMSLMSIPATVFTGIKVITWEHFNAMVEWNSITSPFARKLAALFSSHIVVLTETDKKIFEQRYKARNVITISNPITLQSETPSLLTEKVILSIGRFEPQKGFDMLIDAWEMCRCKEFGWKLKIVGSGVLKSEMEDQIIAKNMQETIYLEPPTHQVIDLYKNSSIFAMSSRFEGLPLVLIEAMFMGLPIVSFDCETGPRDIVKNNITGRLVKANDVKSLAQNSDELAFNPTLLQEYGKNALLYNKQFELAPIIQKWITLIQK